MPEVAELPMSAPIWQVADYGFESAETYADVINERREGQVYGRYGNPTLEALAKVMASLEKAESAWVFSSGMGAIHATLMHFASSGSRVVVAPAIYGGTYGLLTQGFPSVGIDVDFVDLADEAALERALDHPAACVLVETIANPTFRVSDIERIAGICRAHDTPLVVDNTVASPVLVNPLDLGAKIVLHSTSKYIGGHHDLMGGVVCGASELLDDIRHLAIRYGTTASAFESWLALRGVATLGLRMQRQSENALAIARELEAGGAKVSYPFLESHPDNTLAVSMLRWGGGMIAVDLGSQNAAWRFMNACRIARVGSSFGGVRSELTHPATTSHRQFDKADREAAGIGDGLVRLSCGIEDLEDLLEDFKQAMDQV